MDTIEASGTEDNEDDGHGVRLGESPRFTEWAEVVEYVEQKGPDWVFGIEPMSEMLRGLVEMHRSSHLDWEDDEDTEADEYTEIEIAIGWLSEAEAVLDRRGEVAEAIRYLEMARGHLARKRA